MHVWRIEHKDSRVGPFRSGIIYDGFAHGMPVAHQERDIFPIRHDIVRHSSIYRFGFLSIVGAAYWFGSDPEDIAPLIDQGMIVACYDTPQVTHGEFQCVFPAHKSIHLEDHSLEILLDIRRAYPINRCYLPIRENYYA